MGIKKLTSYVQENSATLYKDKFDLKGQNLVFDGCSLYYGLMMHSRCNIRFGGDYMNMYQVFKSYFIRLRKIGVKPFIVIDGGHNIPLKNKTMRDDYAKKARLLRNLAVMKKNDREFPKPRLMCEIFVEVLIELQVNYVFTEGEADMPVAALANRLSCPLVSSDSDFFIVPVQHGVLPMELMLSIKDNTQKCVRFRSSTFAKHVNIKESFLPFLALIIGNDYSEGLILKELKKHCGANKKDICEQVKNISSYLSKFETIKGVIEDLSKGDFEITTHIESVLREFDLNSFEKVSKELFPILNQVCSFDKKIASIVNPDIPGIPTLTFLKHLVYHGLINPCVFDIYLHNTNFIRPQCEDFMQKTSCCASEILRSYTYALLSHRTTEVLKITEFKRVELHCEEVCIEISTSDWTPCYPVDIIENNWYTKSDRINIICNLTDFDMKSLPQVRDEDQIFLISVRYWVQQSVNHNCNLKIEHIQALLVCYIELKFDRRNKFERCKRLERSTASHYCRWQSVMSNLITLNALFRFPFLPPLIRYVFHGNHVHELYQKLKSGIHVSALLGMKEKDIMFDSFMEMVTFNLDLSSPKLLSSEVTKEQSTTNMDGILENIKTLSA